MSFAKFADHMDQQSLLTWRILSVASSLKQPFPEPSITSWALLSLAHFADSAGLPISIKQISAVQENKLGADFEFFVRLHDGNFFALSMQAKRVHLAQRHPVYTELGHPGLAPGTFQYDTLIDHSSQIGSIPIHVLYNGWRRRDPYLPFAHLDDEDRELFGCAAISTHKLRSIREGRGPAAKSNTNKLMHFVDFVFPWSDLFRLEQRSGSATNNAPNAVTSLPPTPSSPRLRGGFGVEEDFSKLAAYLTDSDLQGAASGIISSLPRYVDRAPSDDPPNDPHLPAFALVLGGETRGRYHG
ncbi:hypothetical protein Q9S36_06610 [Microbacterium sp. ARD31]|uniref:DUF6615 family protein n=1 Tax=Microbacterium sp. ARD31 TaxID=2962576 RepID=UPI002880F4FA|nr:DUF6615 family protein [Microbacterium sp. ARD31]MDT0179882.1 hypothetical protein [Microbacterium sp. ARD31]